MRLLVLDFYSDMRVSSALCASLVQLSAGLKSAREVARSLRAELSGPVSCPANFMPEPIVNTIVSTWKNDQGLMEVVYRCNRGYVASNSDASSAAPREFTAACVANIDGSFSTHTMTTCIPGRCSVDPLTSLRNATLSLSDPKVGIDSMVTIQCSAGHSIDGLPTGPRSRQLSCDQDTKLVPLSDPISDNDCKPVTCGPLTVPDNALIRAGARDKQTMTYGQSVDFTCKEGFYFKPTGTVDFSTKSTFTFTCDDGGNMVLINDPTALVPGECVPIPCGPAPSYGGSDVVAKPTDSVVVGSQLQYVCARGAFFTNTTAPLPPLSASHWTNSIQAMVPKMTAFKVQCILDKLNNVAVYDTDPAIARCEAELCVPPQTVLPSNVVRKTGSGDRYFVGDSVEYVCAPGYLYKGKPVSDGSEPELITAKCSDAKEWELDDTFDQCIIGQCDYLSKVPAELLSNTQPDGGLDPTVKLAVKDSVDARCMLGYASNKTGADTIAITCDGNGHYVADSACVRQCGPLPRIPLHTTAALNGSTTVYHVGESITSTAIFTCDDGFSIDGKPVTSDNTVQTLACSDTPAVTPFTPTADALKPCIPVVCGLPPTLPNARWVTSSPVKQYAAGETVDYKCDDGFGKFVNGTVEGTGVQVACTKTGWTHDSDNGCAKITCSNKPTVANGRVVGGNDKDNLAVGDVLEVQCDSGFSVPNFDHNDKVALTCSVSGDFLPINYGSTMCKPIQCPDLPDSLLNAVKASSVTSLKFGDDPVQYKCIPAWNLPAITVRCQEDKTYEVTGEECVLPVCEALPDSMENVVPTNGTSPMTTRLDLACETGFMTPDSALEFKVECRGPGTWAPLNAGDANGCSVKVGDLEPILVR